MFDYADFLHLIQKEKVVLFGKDVCMPSLEQAAQENPWYSGTILDPWPWRIRVAEEGKALYGHFYAGKLAFCSMDFLPVLLYTITPENDFAYRFERGEISPLQKAIVEVLQKEDSMRKDLLRKRVGEENKALFERSLVSLEQDLILCISGQSKKVNKKGQPYGWPINEYALVEKRCKQSFLDLSRMGKAQAFGAFKAFLSDNKTWPGKDRFEEE